MQILGGASGTTKILDVAPTGVIGKVQIGGATGFGIINTTGTMRTGFITQSAADNAGIHLNTGYPAIWFKGGTGQVMNTAFSVAWSDSSDPTAGTTDTGIKRASAGVVEVKLTVSPRLLDSTL